MPLMDHLPKLNHLEVVVDTSSLGGATAVARCTVRASTGTFKPVQELAAFLLSLVVSVPMSFHLYTFIRYYSRLHMHAVAASSNEKAYIGLRLSSLLLTAWHYILAAMRTNCQGGCQLAPRPQWCDRSCDLQKCEPRELGLRIRALATASGEGARGSAQPTANFTAVTCHGGARIASLKLAKQGARSYRYLWPRVCCTTG